MVLLISVLFLCPRSSPAEAARGLHLAQSVGASANPLGLVLYTRLFYRIPVWQRDGLLWESTKIDVGLQNDWTPGDEFIGVRATFEPISFFDVTARAGFYGYFDLLGFGYYPMAGPDAPYDLDTLNNSPSQSAPGYKLTLVPTLKARIGALILANAVEINRIVLDESGHYLEIRSYMIHSTRDTDIINGTYVFWEFRKSFLAGLNYRIAYVRSTGRDSHRLSAIGVLSRETKKLDVLRVLVVAGAYLRDPLYEARPYVAGLASVEFNVTRRRQSKEDTP